MEDGFSLRTLVVGTLAAVTSISSIAVLWYIAETQDRVINLEAIRNTFRTEQLVRYAENWVLRPGDKATSR